MKFLIFALCAVLALGVSTRGRTFGSRLRVMRKCRYGRERRPMRSRCGGRKSDGPDQPTSSPGNPGCAVPHVSQPTMTVYSPKGKNTGAAVVVLPGGGFEVLAIDLEGTEVCDWLTSRGITCVLLKYRVPSEPYDSKCDCRPDDLVTSTRSLEDVQRTIGLVRLHAKEWHIDPHKIGVLGFSAGGYLAAEISTKYRKRLYAPIDDADKESARPDFAVLVYPGHLAPGITDGNTLNPNVPVTPETPPTFLVQAENDKVDGVNQSLVYYTALKKAGVPVEMHLYAQGGHAFGLRHTRFRSPTGRDWSRRGCARSA